MDVLIREGILFAVMALSLLQQKGSYWKGWWKFLVDLGVFIGNLYLVIQYWDAQANLIFQVGVAITVIQSVLWLFYWIIWYSGYIHDIEWVGNLEEWLPSFLNRKDVSFILGSSFYFTIYCFIAVLLGVFPP